MQVGRPAGGSNSTSRWHAAGAALLAAFDHIWVLTLRDAPLRRTHMASLLEGQLGIAPDKITYFMGASGRLWGDWRDVAFLESEEAKAAKRANWWIHTRLCAEDGDFGLGLPYPPQCLRARYAACLIPSAARGSSVPLPRWCGELCYTLSVASAMDAFLKSGRARALFLEDDLCATPALLASLGPLRWLRKHRAEWDLVKLGDCYRGVRPPIERGHVAAAYERAVTGVCASSTFARADMEPNTMPPGIPQLGFCSHALGVTRRMAQHLITQTFPVGDVFDSLLTQHIRRQNQTGMGLHFFNTSVFAQVAKAGGADVPKALRSHNHGKSLQVHVL